VVIVRNGECLRSAGGELFGLRYRPGTTGLSLCTVTYIVVAGPNIQKAPTKGGNAADSIRGYLLVLHRQLPLPM
jgi:hypothetical protein